MKIRNYGPKRPVYCFPRWVILMSNDIHTRHAHVFILFFSFNAPSLQTSFLVTLVSVLRLCQRIALHLRSSQTGLSIPISPGLVGQPMSYTNEIPLEQEFMNRRPSRHSYFPPYLNQYCQQNSSQPQNFANYSALHAPRGDSTTQLEPCYGYPESSQRTTTDYRTAFNNGLSIASGRTEDPSNAVTSGRGYETAVPHATTNSSPSDLRNPYSFNSRNPSPSLTSISLNSSSSIFACDTDNGDFESAPDTLRMMTRFGVQSYNSSPPVNAAILPLDPTAMTFKLRHPGVWMRMEDRDAEDLQQSICNSYNGFIDRSAYTQAMQSQSLPNFSHGYLPSTLANHAKVKPLPVCNNFPHNHHTTTYPTYPILASSYSPIRPEELDLDPTPTQTAVATDVEQKPQKKSKMHYCQICNRGFPRPSGLDTHMNSHYGKKPFPCSVPGCNKSFAVRSNAKRHLRTHGINPSSPVEPPSSPQFTVKFEQSVVNTNDHDFGKPPPKFKWMPPGQSPVIHGNVDWNRSVPSEGSERSPAFGTYPTRGASQLFVTPELESSDGYDDNDSLRSMDHYY